MGFAKALVNLREKRRQGKRQEVQASADREIAEAKLKPHQRRNLKADRERKKRESGYYNA